MQTREVGVAQPKTLHVLTCLDLLHSAQICCSFVLLLHPLARLHAAHCARHQLSWVILSWWSDQALVPTEARYNVRAGFSLHDDKALGLDCLWSGHCCLWGFWGKLPPRMENVHKGAHLRKNQRVWERARESAGVLPAAFALLAAIGSPPACLRSATSSERWAANSAHHDDLARWTGPAPSWCCTTPFSLLLLFPENKGENKRKQEKKRKRNPLVVHATRQMWACSPQGKKVPMIGENRQLVTNGPVEFEK